MGTLKFLNIPLETWESIALDVPEADRLALITAIANYNYYGTEPDNIPAGAAMAVWRSVKTKIEGSRNKARFGNQNAKETQKKRTENAKETQNGVTKLNETKLNETKYSVRESALIDEIYKAYPARNRRDYAASCLSISAAAQGYATVNSLSKMDVLDYMLKQTKLYASIAGRSRFVPRSDTFFAQGDWRGDAEQWRAQFADDETGGMTLAEEIERENAKRRAEENDPALAAEAMERIANFGKGVQ